ncbi:MAG: cytochrome c [Burkholderiales bacterium]|nr:cytochrome c [Burkholderiales bacterium]
MKPNRFALVAVALATVFTTGTIAAAGLKIELPPETAALKTGPGSDLARGQCMSCHSADYITTQPRHKPLAFWKAEVEKMKKVYGAPIQDDQIDLLADYLARNYGAGK